MVKHIMSWKLKDEVVDKEAVKFGIREGLEGKIPGLVELGLKMCL